MLFESYIRNSWGEWTSVGVAEDDPQAFLAFMAKDSGVPRYKISSVTSEGELVVVTRAIACSDVEIERNECLFDDVEDATSFAGQLRMYMIHQRLDEEYP